MFDFKTWMEKNSIITEDIAQKLNTELVDVNNIINSKDEDALWKLYEDYIQIIRDDFIFPELRNFFSKFIIDGIDWEIFIKDILAYRDSNVPRRMLNSIERLITIADKMDLIEKGNDALKIFFIVVCIETLNTLAGSNLNKIEMVTEFFSKYLSEKEKDFIIKKVRRSLANSRYECDCAFSTDIDIDIFARIINEVRNNFVHEGNYFEFKFAQNDGIALLNFLEVDETYEEYRRHRINGKEERVYEINLSYSDFRIICVNGLIRFVKKYFDSENGRA